MSTSKRLQHAFEKALELPFTSCTKYVLISDCHRGTGTSTDNFLKNQHLYFAALKHYYKNNFTYIELGDGDELWENRNMETIIEVHSNIFWMFSLFYKENRLYMLYGNHDIVKRKTNYSRRKCANYFCTATQKFQPLFPELTFYESIILHSTSKPEKSLYLTHGHQASVFNSSLWPMAQFLVQYLWHPLESFGVSDPTSAAKNHHIKKRSEEKLSHWATTNQHILITGHTHRPVLTNDSPFYYNTGSCIHPRCITCIEIESGKLTLVKWCMSAKTDGTLYVSRSVLAGPIAIL